MANGAVGSVDSALMDAVLVLTVGYGDMAVLFGMARYEDIVLDGRSARRNVEGLKEVQHV
jgi:hypothetical protein